MTQLETGITPPADKPKRSRGRAAAAKKTPTPPLAAMGLIKALQFISLAQKSQGTAYQTHCLINRNWLIAHDGVLTIGTKVQEDVSACPHTASLLAALSKCGEQVSITQLSEFSLSVKSGKFKALVECIAFDQMPIVGPDAPSHAANDVLRDGFGKLAWIATEGETQAFKAAVMVQNGSMVATNGSVLLELWHGLELPCQILIPKATAVAVSKVDKKLVGIGGSANSVTFHFEDESFIRSSVFVDRFPDYQRIFSEAEGKGVLPLPPDFFTALGAVSGFGESKFVFFFGDRIQSEQIAEHKGACYEIEGVPDQVSFNADYLKHVEPYFKNTIFTDWKVFFHHENVRGIISGGTHFQSHHKQE
jgi:hypothetical protein